jgi:hypothetical protein
MGCYDIMPPTAQHNPAAAAAAASSPRAASAAVAVSGSSICVLWTGEAGGKLVQQYQQYLQGQLQQQQQRGNGRVTGNGSYAGIATATQHNGFDIEQPDVLSSGSYTGRQASRFTAGVQPQRSPSGLVNRQPSISPALSGLRRNSLTLVGLGMGPSSSKQQHWRKRSGSSSGGSSSHLISAVRRPQGWWQQLTRGVFGIGVVEEEALHADRYAEWTVFDTRTSRVSCNVNALYYECSVTSKMLS